MRCKKKNKELTNQSIKLGFGLLKEQLHNFVGRVHQMLTNQLLSEALKQVQFIDNTSDGAVVTLHFWAFCKYAESMEK